MKRILVIGGAGYIGSHTVVELAAVGFCPVILDDFSNSSHETVRRLEEITGQKITCYEQDYRDAAKLAEVIKKESVDGIVHFAAFKSVGESIEQPLRYYHNNVAGFIALLEMVLAQDIKHFVFSSSAAVYGNPPTRIVTEDTPCAPESPYGWSKYMDEIVLRDTCASHPELQGVALRYFNVVGSHESATIGELSKQRPQNLLPLVVAAAAGTRPMLTVHGNDYPTPDGTCLRDYIHVVDLAKAHVAALKKTMQTSSTNYRVYNVGTGTPTSVLELIATFEKINHTQVPHEIGPRRAGDLVAFYASVDKAKRELGWHAEKTIEDAVRDAWNWQQTMTTNKGKD